MAASFLQLYRLQGKVQRINSVPEAKTLLEEAEKLIPDPEAFDDLRRKNLIFSIFESLQMLSTIEEWDMKIETKLSNISLGIAELVDHLLSREYVGKVEINFFKGITNINIRESYKPLDLFDKEWHLIYKEKILWYSILE